MRKFTAALVFLFIQNSFASGDQTQRFTKWMDVLEKSFKAPTPEKSIENLLGQPLSRIAAFNLQGLAALYKENDDDTFSKIQKFAKTIEDGLGKYDKAKTLSQPKAQEAAKKDLIKTSKEEKWSAPAYSPKIREYRKFLIGFNWPSADEDRQRLLKKFAKDLKSIRTTEYGLSVLEDEQNQFDGNGLHEYRRDNRWISIKMRSLGGLVQFDPNESHCPVPSLVPLLTAKLPEEAKKYVDLPVEFSWEKPCYISRCLYLGLVVNVIHVFGQYKDQCEKLNSKIDDKDPKKDLVPEKILSQALKSYEDIKSQNIQSSLETQLRSCLPAE